MSRINLQRYLIISLFLLAGAVFGAIYAVNKADMASAEGYLRDFFSSEYDVRETLVTGLKQNGIIFLILFAGAWTRAGILLPPAVGAFKGFSAGAAAVMFYRAFGIEGGLIILAVMPKNILLLGTIVLFGTACFYNALSKERTQSGFLGRFLIKCAAAAVLFAAAALCDAYVTSAVMGKIAGYFL